MAFTSNFRDEHVPRYARGTRLAPQVRFPGARRRLRTRFHHLDVVDLRWGVDSATAEQEEVREVLVLTVCLREIERSRPFLVGLIGDRYGWIPPEQRTVAAAAEAGFAAPVAGKSVTELEIVHGVLHNSDQQRRSWFYLREPLPYASMHPDDAGHYSDADSKEPGAAENVQKLAELKTTLRKALKDRVRSYSAEWDAKARHGS